MILQLLDLILILFSLFLILILLLINKGKEDKCKCNVKPERYANGMQFCPKCLRKIETEIKEEIIK